MFIETKRCIIRNMTLFDKESLHKVYSDIDVMTYIEQPYSKSQTVNFITKYGIIKQPLIYSIVLKESNNVIGHLIYHKFEDNKFELGWILNKNYWGLGLATEITEYVIKYAKNQGIGSLIIECVSKQTSTIHIALKNNFVYQYNDGQCNIYELKLL